MNNRKDTPNMAMTAPSTTILNAIAADIALTQPQRIFP